jgi:RND family efflux transporter MFP subunit
LFHFTGNPAIESQFSPDRGFFLDAQARRGIVSLIQPLRLTLYSGLLLLPLVVGCKKESAVAAQQQAQPQAMPVQVASINLAPVPTSDTYVATIKSRRSSTMQPQVDGNLTHIYVKSGDFVKAGQVLMQVDPLKQIATVESQQGTEAQKKAIYDYNKTDVERQRQLFEAGVTSRQTYDQAIQAYENSKADLAANSALTNTQKRQLAYYDIRAPFDGVVGDIPVHVGDYVSPTTLLTTVDENADLEAYIYIPTERVTQVRTGLDVEIMDTSGEVLAKSVISFLSPQVDNGLQSILAKAEIPHSAQRLRNGQLVKARVIWSTAPAPTVPVLAVSLVGGQPFVFVAQPKGEGFVAHQIPVTLGETIGNQYPVISGLKPGDKVITSGLQLLQEGVPVRPIG